MNTSSKYLFAPPCRGFQTFGLESQIETLFFKEFSVFIFDMMIVFVHQRCSEPGGSHAAPWVICCADLRYAFTITFSQDEVLEADKPLNDQYTALL